MIKKNKAIICVALGIALILVGKFLYDRLLGYCPRCREPVILNEVLQITSDYENLTIIYSKNNGSLPPMYHREDIFTITTDEMGNSTGEYVARDYEKELEKRPLTVSREQLNELLGVAAQIDPKTDGSANLGCTGGSVKSISVVQDKKTLLRTSAYNCGGESSNESLGKFSDEIEGMFK